MKIFLKKAIFVNRAPFDKLELDFSENEIGVLSAVNGKGKTTILSHIADSFYEMARLPFSNEFEGKENKLYRVSSGIYNLKKDEPSFVYLRFEIKDKEIKAIDHLDIRGNCTEKEYNKAITLSDKIPFDKVNSLLKSQSVVKPLAIFIKNELLTEKQLSEQKEERIRKVFLNNLLTYFPSYRYEQPGYLNDPYKIRLDFTKKHKSVGHLHNPIEVVTGLSQLANWIMDVYLDLNVGQVIRSEKYLKNLQKLCSDKEQDKEQRSEVVLDMLIDSLSSKTGESTIFSYLNEIIEKTLSSKGYGNIGFGIGPRHFGDWRIGIYQNTFPKATRIYPNIFNLSSGESALLCIFGELLRQADNNKHNIQLEEITGIVLIDEVDKHLHIKLQKEILPQLFKMFPNVQFITSSHSPFVNMGLADIVKERPKIIDLDNFGISQDPTSNELYREVYNMMISEDEQFKNLYQSLKQKTKNGTKPIIVTEGKTDTKHIKKAKEKLNITNCDFEFYEAEEERGDSKLKTVLEHYSKLPNMRKIIGIFDRDNSEIISDIEKNNQPYKNYGNNVYAFCLPVPNSRKKYKNVSIEFYYSDKDIKKEKDGKRLYFTNEIYFEQSASDKQNRNPHKRQKPKEDEEFCKKIFNEKINSLDGAHSKSIFSDLVASDEDFTSGFDFSNFTLIFDKIKEIVNPTD